MYSARPNSYVEAMIREGDNFDYEAWLRRVSAEEAAAKAANTRPLPHGARMTSHQTREPTGKFTKNGSLPTYLCPRSTSAKRTTHQRPAGPISIRDELLRVCDAWDKFQDSRTRDAVYIYLRAVYSVVLKHRGKRRTRKLVRRAAKFAGLPLESDAEPFAVIIRCTSEQSVDIKTISKWSRALRYAAYRKRALRHLKRFMNGLGGIK